MEQYVTVTEVTGLVTVHGQLVMVKVVAWRGSALALSSIVCQEVALFIVVEEFATQ